MSREILYRIYILKIIVLWFACFYTNKIFIITDKLLNYINLCGIISL